MSLNMDPNTPSTNPEVMNEKERLQNPVVTESQPVVEVAPAPIESVGEERSLPSVEMQRPTEEPKPIVAQPITTPKISPHRPVVTQTKDRLEKEIEDVLQEDLTELYTEMPPDKQKIFKEKGEETAQEVRTLVQAVHINAKKIFQLIRTWLVIIPGVNRFFLEQEAKIKTDKVLLVTEEEKRRGSKDSL